MNPREIIATHGGDQAGHFSDDAIARLASEIERLREIKRSRMGKVSRHSETKWMAWLSDL
jgi:protein regulator of cytokinesis 1